MRKINQIDTRKERPDSMFLMSMYQSLNLRRQNRKQKVTIRTISQITDVMMNCHVVQVKCGGDSSIEPIIKQINWEIKHVISQQAVKLTDTIIS